MDDYSSAGANDDDDAPVVPENTTITTLFTAAPPAEETTVMADDAFWETNQSHGYNHTPLQCTDGYTTMTLANRDDDDNDGGATPESCWKAMKKSNSDVDNDDAPGEDATTSQQFLLAIADTALSRLELDYQRTVSASKRTTAVPTCTTEDEDNDEEDPVHPCIPTRPSSSNQTNPVAVFRPDFASVPLSQFEPPTAPVAVPKSTGTAAYPTTSTSSNVVSSPLLLQPPSDHFHAKYLAWESAQRSIPPPVPHVHSMIPTSVLTAFRVGNSAKTTTTTARLTRSATLADACIRLDVLGQPSMTCFVVHVIGCCDAVEGGNRNAPQQFGPFVEWLGHYVECPRGIRIDLIGPELTAYDHPIDVLPSCQATSRLQSAHLYHHGAMLYEDFLQQQSSSPHLIVAFHAGVWGYASWRPCLQAMVQQPKKCNVPFVCTAYTLEEAEDDGEVLGELLAQQQCVWSAEPHRFGSHVERPTATAPAHGRPYRENAAWQCWMV